MRISERVRRFIKGEHKFRSKCPTNPWDPEALLSHGVKETSKLMCLEEVWPWTKEPMGERPLDRSSSLF